MNRQSNSHLIRGAIYLALYAPAVALLFYFLGGVLPFVLEALSIDAGTGLLQGIYSHVCHQIPDRSFSFNTAQMGFCSRCTGLYGSLALVSLITVMIGRTKSISWIWLPLLCTPILVDVTFDIAESLSIPNVFRMITGLLAGTGIALSLYPRLVFAIRYSLAPERDA